MDASPQKGEVSVNGTTTTVCTVLYIHQLSRHISRGNLSTNHAVLKAYNINFEHELLPIHFGADLIHFGIYHLV